MAILYIRDPETGEKVPIRAIKGEDGHQMFVRFSAYADGTDMSETWDDTKDYMGIAFASTAPTDKGAYQWILLSSFPKSLTLDAENNLHVEGEVTYGDDNFAPREEIAKTNNTVSALSEIVAGFGDSTKIATGRYVGTDENPASLTFPFVPKFFMITSDDTDGEFVAACVVNEGNTSTKMSVVGKAGSIIGVSTYLHEVTVSGNTVSWTNSAHGGPAYLLNSSTMAYKYVVWG